MTVVFCIPIISANNSCYHTITSNLYYEDMFSVHTDLFSAAAVQEPSGEHQQHGQYLVMEDHHVIQY